MSSYKLGNEGAGVLVSSTAFRAKISHGISFNASPEDIIGCLEHAVTLVEESEPAAKKIRNAVSEGTIAAYDEDVFKAALDANVIDEDELKLLRATEKAVRRAIDVDDFSTEELWGEQSGKAAA